MKTTITMVLSFLKAKKRASLPLWYQQMNAGTNSRIATLFFNDLSLNLAHGGVEQANVRQIILD